VTENRHSIHTEVLANSVEILDLRADRHVLRSDARGRLSASALVVVDETKALSQAIHFGKQVAVIEVGPAVENHDRCSGSDFTEVETRARYCDEALVHRCRHFANHGGLLRESVDPGAEVSYGIDLGAVLAEQNIQEPATLAGVRSV
jgi:hypothetical protein